jgi:hypothetical protein
MQELKWTEPLPDRSFDGGLKLLDDLKWNLAVKEVGGVWFVQAGHIKLLATSSREAVDAFLYGLALAYSVMPRELLDQFRTRMIEASK